MFKRLNFIIFILLIINSAYGGDDFNYTYITLSHPNNIGCIFASFFVEDANGRKTGENPILREFYYEIPGARFGDEGYGDDLSSEPGIYFIIFDSENMLEGRYSINVIGTGSDSFKLHIGAERINADKYEFQYTGLIHKGEVYKFRLNYSPDPSVPITVEEVKDEDPISLIDELIAYITNATNSGSIDNKGIANSLISKLEEAKRQLEKGKSKQAVNALNAFLNELSGQHEKHISDEVYGYLKEKVERLITQLESSG